MNIENFIGVFPNALNDELCERIISHYEESNDLNYTMNRSDFGSSPRETDNNLVFANCRSMIPDGTFFQNIQPDVKKFVETSWQCYEYYAKKYGVLQSLARHRFYDSIKIQKTEPSGGYHVWHCESDNRVNGSRLLLVMCYLNDVTDGGETEFLYQSRRIQPERGTIVICPASFTHTHRGNPPLSGEKYMINGWIEFE